MTRAASAPSWPLPASPVEQILRPLRAVAQMGTQELLKYADEQRARAKSLGICLSTQSMNLPRETPTKTQAPKSLTSRAVASIADEIAATPVASQRGTTAQYQRQITPTDERILRMLEQRGDIVTTRQLAGVVKASVWQVRDRLDRLVADGRVENVPGRGYRLVAGVKTERWTR